jgi:hypothetical protein
MRPADRRTVMAGPMGRLVTALDVLGPLDLWELADLTGSRAVPELVTLARGEGHVIRCHAILDRPSTYSLVRVAPGDLREAALYVFRDLTDEYDMLPFALELPMEPRRTPRA